MLDTLKTFVFRTSPEKSDGESALELVERGQVDRAQRLESEAEAKRRAALAAARAEVRAADEQVRLLVQSHAAIVHELGLALQSLASIAEQLRRVEVKIDRGRATVAEGQRTLGANALELAPYTTVDGAPFRSYDLLPAVRRAIGG